MSIDVELLELDASILIEQTPRIIFLFEIILSVLFRGVLLYLMDVFVQRSYLEQPTSLKSRLPLGKGLSIDVELLELEDSILVRLTPRNISRGLKPREIFFGVT